MESLFLAVGAVMDVGLDNSRYKYGAVFHGCTWHIEFVHLFRVLYPLHFLLSTFGYADDDMADILDYCPSL